MVFVEATFLIDLQRHPQLPSRQAAVRWLEENTEVEIGISTIVYGEFAEGFSDPTDPLMVHLSGSYRIVPVDLAVAQVYGQISRDLRRSGGSIGANDTWIAATAVLHERPLLTRNLRHFERVSDLAIYTYL